MSRWIVPLRTWPRRVPCARMLCRASMHQSAVKDVAGITQLERSFVSPLSSDYSEASQDDFVTGSRSDERSSVMRRIQEVIKPGKMVYLGQVDRFIRAMSKVDSIRSMECLYLIKACGSQICDALPEQRHQLIDSLKELFKNKKAPLDTSHYNTLLNIQCLLNYPQDPMDFLNEMKEADVEPNRVTYRRILHRYCQMGQPDGAYKILEKMKELEFPIDESVFNSLILGNLRANKFENAENTYQLMKNSGLEPSRDTYKCFLLGYIDHLGEEGVEKRIDELLMNIQQDDITLSFSDVTEIIYALSKVDEKSKFIDKVLESVPRRVGYNVFLQYTINLLLRSGKIDLAYRIFLTYMEPSPNTLRLLTPGSFFVMAMVQSGIEMNKVVQICEDLESKKMNQWIYLKAAQVALQHCDLDTGIKYLDLFEKKTGMSRIHFTWPRLCNCKNDEQMLEVLQKKVLNYSLVSPNAVVETFQVYVWPRVKENKINFYLKCEEIGFELEMLALSLSKSINNSRTLKEYEINLLIEEYQKEFPNHKSDDIKRLLGSLCSMNRLNLSPGLLKPLLKNTILNSSKEIAVAEWFDHVKKFRSCVCKSVIMQKLIQEDDSKALQDVVDYCIRQVGEGKTMSCLALAFLKCGKLKQAKKLLARPGFFLAETTLERMCQSLIDNGEIEILEKLVECTKGLPQLNREKQYRLLLEGYITHGAVDKALEMWTVMQDEDLVPSSQILSRLASFLKASGREIPFEYKDEILELEHANMVENLKLNLRKAVRSGNLNEALEIKKKLLEANCELTLGEECSIIEQFIRGDATEAAIDMTKKLMDKGRYPSPRLYRLLFQRMVSRGMIKELEDMVQVLPPTLKQAEWFSDLFIRAHANLDQNKLDGFLKTLKEFKYLPISAMLYLLNNSPQNEKVIYDSLKKMAKEQQTNLHINIIWLHLMLKGQYGDAQKLFESTPRLSETLITKPLLDQIRKGNTELRHHLIEQLKFGGPHLLKSIELLNDNVNKT